MLFMFIFLLSGGNLLGQKQVDFEKERAALLEVHQTDRRAHFLANGRLLLENSADEFIYVGNGKITRSKRNEFEESFKEYFKDVKYYNWDDLEPPIIKISNDASMAWMIVRIKVRRVKKLITGEDEERGFIYAGIMTYEKQNGKWVRIANVSTFE